MPNSLPFSRARLDEIIVPNSENTSGLSADQGFSGSRISRLVGAQCAQTPSPSLLLRPSSLF